MFKRGETNGGPSLGALGEFMRECEDAMHVARTSFLNTLKRMQNGYVKLKNTVQELNLGPINGKGRDECC